MARLDELNSWHDDWSGLRVAVVGLGVTGFSVADTLAELGCEVTVFAEHAQAEQLDILDVLGVKHVITVNSGSSANLVAFFTLFLTNRFVLLQKNVFSINRIASI